MHIIQSFGVIACSSADSSNAQDTMRILCDAVNHCYLLIKANISISQRHKVTRFKPAEGPVQFEGIFIALIFVAPCQLFGQLHRTLFGINIMSSRCTCLPQAIISNIFAVLIADAFLFVSIFAIVKLHGKAVVQLAAVFA